MKRVYRIFLIVLSAAVLSCFLPWLYSVAFPAGTDYPFVAYSPLSRSFIVSDAGADGRVGICAVSDGGDTLRRGLSKEERDSLLPQIYFSQLVARDCFPDSVAGRAVSVPLLKHGQWVYTSLPRDINRVDAGVYLMMESMPARFELEDPEVVFRFRDDGVQFVDIATNSVDSGRSRRFTGVFRDRGFVFPAISMSADITSRKAYDEGYLMADAAGSVYHVKMQAGRPYMVKVPGLPGVKAEHVFVMENTDRRQLGLVTDADDRMYVIEREGYRLCRLPVDDIDPSRDRFTVMANVFNWVVRIENDRGVRWIALDADDYSLLGRYAVPRGVSVSETVASYIFPYVLSFTSVSDCHVRPRVGRWSWRVLCLNVLLALCLTVICRRRGEPAVAGAAATLLLGLYAFIPLALIRD